jgi:hypothetical protein
VKMNGQNIINPVLDLKIRVLKVLVSSN